MEIVAVVMFIAICGLSYNTYKNLKEDGLFEEKHEIKEVK